jgi:hypothetical protein
MRVMYDLAGKPFTWGTTWIMNQSVNATGSCLFDAMLFLLRLYNISLPDEVHEHGDLRRLIVAYQREHVSRGTSLGNAILQLAIHERDDWPAGEGYPDHKHRELLFGDTSQPCGVQALQSFFSAYSADMARPNAYGSETELLAFCDLFNVTALMLSGTTDVYCNVFQPRVDDTDAAAAASAAASAAALMPFGYVKRGSGAPRPLLHFFYWNEKTHYYPCADRHVFAACNPGLARRDLAKRWEEVCRDVRARCATTGLLPTCPQTGKKLDFFAAVEAGVLSLAKLDLWPTRLAVSANLAAEAMVSAAKRASEAAVCGTQADPAAKAEAAAGALQNKVHGFLERRVSLASICESAADVVRATLAAVATLTDLAYNVPETEPIARAAAIAQCAKENAEIARADNAVDPVTIRSAKDAAEIALLAWNLVRAAFDCAQAIQVFNDASATSPESSLVQGPIATVASTAAAVVVAAACDFNTATAARYARARDKALREEHMAAMLGATAASRSAAFLDRQASNAARNEKKRLTRSQEKKRIEEEKAAAEVAQAAVVEGKKKACQAKKGANQATPGKRRPAAEVAKKKISPPPLPPTTAAAAAPTRAAPAPQREPPPLPRAATSSSGVLI